LPIGHGQTISQPSLVALMTDRLDVKPTDVVLEVGTGSGYQAAVLAQLVQRVYSVERVEPLARQASARLARLGYDNVEVRCADGYDGWREHAPYDAICVTAAAATVPPALLEQLAPGGRMVIPVEDQLKVVTKDAEGRVSQRMVAWVMFVPLVHEPPVDEVEETARPGLRPGVFETTRRLPVTLEDWDVPRECADCGASLWEDEERAFAYSPGAYLCWDCAIRRGGVFDASHSSWTRAPDLRDLPDERRPHL
jgi:protein-L-isoaspartate(D-aspartate) O-methyltransferase